MHNVDPTAEPAGFSVDLLAERITAILAKLGHVNPRGWMSNLDPITGLHPDTVNPAVDADAHRFLINRYWHNQLGILGTQGHNTMDARYCLVPQGGHERWLELFEQKVAPWIVEHNLPKA